MIVGTRRAWSHQRLPQRGALGEARRQARESGAAVAVVDCTGHFTVIRPDGTQKRLTPVEAALLRRAWCALGWPELADVEAHDPDLEGSFFDESV